MNESNDKETRAERYLNLAKTERRGRLKIYIGMSAGVGKTTACYKRRTAGWRPVKTSRSVT